MATYNFLLHENIMIDYWYDRLRCLVVPNDHPLSEKIQVGDSLILESDTSSRFSPVYRRVVYKGMANVNKYFPSEFPFTILGLK